MTEEGFFDEKEKWEEQIRTGYKWQLTIASWLMWDGFVCDVEPLKVARRKDQINFYSDNYDIHVRKEVYHESPKIKVEVKSSSYAFESPETFPFPNAIIDRTLTWRRKGYESHPGAVVPAAVVICSDPSKVALVALYETTRTHWIVKDIEYKKSKRADAPGYWVPREYLIHYNRFLCFLNLLFDGRWGDKYFIP